jgi:hypothetical protein
MGLIPDSSVLIAAERKNQPFSDLLVEIRAANGFGNIPLPAVGVMELEHGYWRANTDLPAMRR